MSDHDHGLTGVHETGKKCHYLLAGLRVEVSRRFVRDHECGIVRQRSGDRGALLLTAGERSRRFISLIGDSHIRQQMQRACSTLARFERIAKVHGQHDVFGDRQRRQQLKELEDYAD